MECTDPAVGSLTPAGNGERSAAELKLFRKHLKECAYCRAKRERLLDQAVEVWKAELTEHPSAEDLYNFGSKQAARPLPAGQALKVERHLLVCGSCHDYVKMIPAVDEAYEEFESGLAFVERLAEEQRRVGFVPKPLADYLDGCIHSAGVSAAQILSRLGVETLSQGDAQGRRAAVELARAIGMGVRRTLAHVRLGFLNQLNPGVISFQLESSGRDKKQSERLEECERVIEELTFQCDLSAREELQRLEGEVREAYRWQARRE